MFESIKEKFKKRGMDNFDLVKENDQIIKNKITTDKWLILTYETDTNLIIPSNTKISIIYDNPSNRMDTLIEGMIKDIKILRNEDEDNGILEIDCSEIYYKKISKVIIKKEHIEIDNEVYPYSMIIINGIRINSMDDMCGSIKDIKGIQLLDCNDQFKFKTNDIINIEYYQYTESSDYDESPDYKDTFYYCSDTGRVLDCNLNYIPDTTHRLMKLILDQSFNNEECISEIIVRFDKIIGIKLCNNDEHDFEFKDIVLKDLSYECIKRDKLFNTKDLKTPNSMICNDH